MKFGRKIKTDLYSEWRPFYIDYNILKRELKARTTSHTWDRADEDEFTRMLEHELDKIHDFQKKKTAELSRRIKDAQRQVKRLVADEYVSEESQLHLRHPSQAEPSTDRTDPEVQQARDRLEQDAGSDDDDESVGGEGEGDSDIQSVDALEDQFHLLEEEVATLVADVHDLALYTKLNITGFMKILKKHDKQTSYPLKQTFIQDYIEKRPFYKYNWDALIVKLSKLYDLVRTRGHPVQGDSSAGGTQSAFVRQTTKYWVHPDNLVALKLVILRHLPVLVFDAEKEFEPKDAAITSIYFDNEDLELYLGRLEKTEGAEAIRLRWYGDVDNKQHHQIFVERKTHREDWTGEKSVKARFPIKEEKVNAFLSGEYIMDAEFEALVARGKKSQQEVDRSSISVNTNVALTTVLGIVMRTFYNRTAFQLPGDARVRISLDTELTMVREDNWDGSERAGDNWRRTDMGIDWPFDQLPAEDKELFQHGVLEVKLQTQFGQEPPQWVTELVNSHLVEAVPKFSKFIHGCATLLQHRVDLVPFWLPQMDVDILKPSTGFATVERPQHISSKSTSERMGNGSSGITTPDTDKAAYVEPVSEGEEDEGIALEPAKDEGKRMGLTGQQAADAIAYREKMLKEREQVESSTSSQQKQKAKANGENGYHGTAEGQEEEFEEEADVDERTPFLQLANERENAVNTRTLSIDPLAPSSAFDETFKDRLRKEEAERRSAAAEVEEGGEEGEGPSRREGEDRILVRDFVAPAGKRVAIPIRIEPKVYFATERTFLKWLHFAVYIGMIATTLLNFVPPDDYRGLISAGLFTFAALLAIAYSAVIFVYRAYKLRKRHAEGMYYDRYGPTILCGVLLAALVTNIVLRVTEIM
ncbi:hypothetical protein EW146_g4745 [Bondarzewia mesenterica]|uniref:Vacuolar transporter chaperone complex subunit 4 n=1 Tax=Bondarzewia mesenterica TaxID=1095465 RepID=A0A4S4LU40_9AGAM|nr:hypothetical protein EW146_g4745 [Bondarzewia mesenterica]